MKRMIIIGVLFALALVQALPLFAEGTASCAPLSALAEQLATKYGERRVAAGLSAQGMLFQVFQSQSGTWTLVVSDAAGRACALAAGTNWETYPIPKAGTEG